MDNRSNQGKLMVAAAVAAVLAAGPLTAQTEKGGQPPQEIRAAETPQISIVKHDVLVGAVVTNGRDETPLAKVSDLVLDGQSGQVRHAVLTVGRKQTLMAWHALKWDDKKACFTLSMTAEALDALPEFDPQKMQRVGNDKGSGMDGEGTNHGSGDAKRDALDAKWRETSLLASKIGDCGVLAGKEKIGSAAAVFIEPTTGSAAFLAVASGGVLGIGETSYLVPWGALRFVKPIGEKANEIHLDKTPKDLEAAPKLGDSADVNKPEFRDKVYKFYGVEKPAFESMKPKAKDDNSAYR
jgi:hypothetical protein